jgi:hypothetical protein
VKGNDHGQCLADETLTEYLEGHLDPAMRAVSEVHLVSCQRCREQLAFFMRVLQPDVSAEEESQLQAIADKWDKNKVGAGVHPRRLLTARWLVGWVAVAALIVGGVSIWFVRHSAEPGSATEVVQLLLGQTRPFEARMAGQPHRAIVPRTRGVENSGGYYSLLSGEMTRLQASGYEMGRFYLLQKDFTRALPYLEMAERESGASAAVHNDLGVALMEGGNADQFEKAGTEFLHAIKQDASFADPVFNLALFYERTNARVRAEAQWKQYLEMDSKSEWATEARERLQELSR